MGQTKQKRGPIEYKGTTYPSIHHLGQEIAKENNLHDRSCARKIREAIDNGLDLEAAVGYASKHHRKDSIEYLGETFESLTSLSKHLGIHIVTLRERILKEWPEEMWGNEKLPTQSPDFYFAIDNPETIQRPCSVYVAELKRFEEYQKAGVAVSPTHRQDAEYGEELYAKQFDNRLKALIFEGAILQYTQTHEEFPIELMPPHREKRWHGITELRKMTWLELECAINLLEKELDEIGFEGLALRYIPMSAGQRKKLGKTLDALEQPLSNKH